MILSAQGCRETALCPSMHQSIVHTPVNLYCTLCIRPRLMTYPWESSISDMNTLAKTRWCQVACDIVVVWAAMLRLSVNGTAWQKHAICVGNPGAAVVLQLHTGLERSGADSCKSFSSAALVLQVASRDVPRWGLLLETARSPRCCQNKGLSAAGQARTLCVGMNVPKADAPHFVPRHDYLDADRAK